MIKNAQGIYNWTYTTDKIEEEPYADDIATFNEILYNDDRDISAKLKDIVDIIRKKNIFPIIYYNKEGIAKEIQSVIKKNNVTFVDDVLYTKSYEGLLLLDFLFPNLHLAEGYSLTNNNIYNRFFDDNILMRCLERTVRYSHKFTNMRNSYLANSRYLYYTPINYWPIRAKAIYEKFCPPNGTIYDYSCGYGGRMMGALCSNNNFTYIGVEPCCNTFINLHTLGEYIEKETQRTDSYKLYNLGSEVYQPIIDSIDFAFSCPPFFKHEIYADEPTQSVAKFPEYEDWLEGYVRPTIRNCYVSLKKSGVFGFDITNYAYGKQSYNLVGDWMRIALEEGFYFKKSFSIKSGYRKSKEDSSAEIIYMFMKDRNAELPSYTTKAQELNRQKELAAAAETTAKRKIINIGQYDMFGDLIAVHTNIDKLPSSVLAVLNKKQSIDNSYWKIYRGNSVVESKIEVKRPVCLIDGVYYLSFAEAGRAIKVSRQAIAKGCANKATHIAGHDITWI